MKEKFEEENESGRAKAEEIEPRGSRGEAKGGKPAFSIVQPEVNAAGNKVFHSVGGMWRNVSKNGREFYVVKIGRLKLLAFKNEAE